MITQTTRLAHISSSSSGRYDNNNTKPKQEFTYSYTFLVALICILYDLFVVWFDLFISLQNFQNWRIYSLLMHQKWMSKDQIWLFFSRLFVCCMHGFLFFPNILLPKVKSIVLQWFILIYHSASLLIHRAFCGFRTLSRTHTHKTEETIKKTVCHFSWTAFSVASFVANQIDFIFSMPNIYIYTGCVCVCALVHSGCAFMITIEPLGTCNTINTTVSLMNFNFFVLCFSEPFYGSFYGSKNAK